MASAYVVFYCKAINSATYVMIGRKHQNCPNNGGQRAIPGGRADPEESLFDAACRELWEETRLVIDAWPASGQPSGNISGFPYTGGGRQFDGFYVAYIKLDSRDGRDQITQDAAQNLNQIPANIREFVSFQVVSQEDAIQAFADDDQPNNRRRRTNWFREAILEVP